MSGPDNHPQARRAARWIRPAAAIASLIALSAATGWAAASLASTTRAPDAAMVRTALELRLPKTPITQIDCKGIGGLCEVASKSTLFYVDRAARYLVIGRVYDMETRQDLTAARLLELNPDLLTAGAPRTAQAQEASQQAPRASATKVSLAGLPANGAIRWGPANGLKAVVFSDFNCGYCKKLAQELRAIGARVEERPISVLGPDSRREAEHVLCAARQDLALRLAYAGTAVSAPPPCDTSGLDANEAFAKANGFMGTPVIVRPSDGAVLEGYRPAHILRAFLSGKPAPAQTPTTKG